MYRQHRIAVVIPAHNEARLIGQTVKGLPEVVDHILVVDDASTDETTWRARATERAGLEIIQHPVNRGVGAAITTGYRRALALGVDVTVVVGADAQMDPTEMPRLLDPVVEGVAEYAKGERLSHRGVWRTMPPLRLAGTWVLTWLTRVATGYWRVRDTQCGYTALHRRALAQLPLDQLYPRYGYPNDLLARLSEIGARVVDRPVTPIYGEARSELRIPRVMGPILGILARAVGRRIKGGLLRRQEALSSGAVPSGAVSPGAVSPGAVSPGALPAEERQ